MFWEQKEKGSLFEGAVSCKADGGSSIVEAVEKKFMNFFSTLRRKTPQKAAKRLLRKNS